MTLDEIKLKMFEKALNDVLTQATDGLTKEEFYSAFEAVLKVVKDIKSTNEQEWTMIHAALQVLSEKVRNDNSDDLVSFKETTNTLIQSHISDIDSKLASVDAKMATVKSGKDADEERIISAVLEQIKFPEQKEIVLDTPVDIRSKLESLEGDERLDASAIRNLPDLIKEHVGSAKPGVLTASALYSMADVNVAGIAAGQFLKWDGVSWVPGTGGGGGGGTTFYTETPSGLINGSNKTYTVLHSITSVLNFSINGSYIHPTDYTAVGTTITFVTALDASLSGLQFTITYA